MGEPQLTGTETDEIEVGRNAESLLEDPLLSRAFADVQNAILRQIAEAEDDDAVLTLKRRLEGVKDGLQALRYYIATGKHAEARLTRWRAFKDKVGKVKHKIDRFRFAA